MKNLGKYIAILFFPALLSAQVIATLDSLKVQEGDLVTLTLEIKGSNAKKPNIDSICGEKIVSTAQHTNMQIINAQTSKSISYSYQFFATKSCEIPAIEVEVDGTIEKTTPLSLSVGAVATNTDQDFVLDLQSSKQEVYRSEPFELVLTFKQKQGAGVLDSEFRAPSLQGFWMQGEPRQEKFNQGAYTVTKLFYTISAQRDANLSISPAEIRIATRSHRRDSWGMWSPNVQWKTYRSNALDIAVKPIPNGVDLVGDFMIEASVDKSSIHANEAVNVTIRVKGDGNLEDMPAMKPYVKDVSVFDEKAVIQDGIWSQKIAFVADRDFTIPPFNLKYFDPKTEQIKEISTQEIAISVQNDRLKEEMVVHKADASDDLQIPQESSVTTSDKDVSYLALVFAFFAGVLLSVGFFYLRGLALFSREKSISIDDEKHLLVKLMPYKKDPEVEEILELLEQNIYGGKKNTIEKKRLKALVKKYL